ncbi:hypothetical protein Gotur_023432, partial [Gossypium turneri]
MNRIIFFKLCEMLQTLGGLKSSRDMLVDEQVTMLLHIISYHLKNRVIKHHFNRSRETVSRSFHNVLNVVIRLQDVLFQKAEPITVNFIDPRWKWFKNCLGALDGTHIKIRVPTIDNPRYRTRKGDISANMLGVCKHDMHFVYVLPGWEGSIADVQVLRDGISRRHGLNGYQPSTLEEFFNMKHASVCNVIEKCFGLLKLRWGILRSPLLYLTYMSLDLIEAELGEGLASNVIDDVEPNIVNIHPSD